MELVTLALGSPRGRFFCANVAYKCSADARAAGFNRPQTTADAREVIEGVDISAILELSEMDLLEALGYAADLARYWQPPNDDDVKFADPHVVAALRPIAAAVLSSEHTTWWGESVDVDNQRLVVHPMSPVEWPELTAPYRPASSSLDEWRKSILANETRFRERRTAEPDSEVAGEWWSTPIFATLTSSRARNGIGSLELLMEEDSSGGGEAQIWPVHVRNSPRVYEIWSPSDWAHLVEKYPLAVPESRRSVWFDTTGEHRNWFIPDWAAVAEDYDAAHLSLHGYLTTPGIAILLSDNERSTLLGGWDPDATFWLNPDVVDIDDEPALWRRADERWERA
ncbi:hypothetical protein C5142_00610 [Rhodococcus sp. BGS-1C]|uniref:hypothetical protein n=1 Tax=unclassified Rhodococcus (in: high G+C Gram-positive bacteria) TaxID=192944 RepID=UPI0019D155E5|nr:hypothetical protein [Rhodococcus sp. KRD197]